MTTLSVILLIVLLVLGLFLVGAVLLQRSKNKKSGLSGAIVGGIDTFVGREQGEKADKLLDRLTKIAAIVFVALVLVVYIIQPDYAQSTFASLDDWASKSVYSQLFK
ncbi:MAG: preprotein translocase subunit SecG [Clostridia bacterium]|nr:preprotein translocase subunit SecG [Clostridia bacterium]